MKRTWMLWIAVAAMLVVVPVALAADGGGKAHAKGTGVFGELTAVGEKEITVAVRAKEKGAAPESKVLAVNAETKVKIAKPPAAGVEKAKPEFEEGKISDLKVGQRVMVKCSEDGKTALEIIVTAPHERKGGKK